MIRSLLLLLVFTMPAAAGDRVLSIGGSITEIVYALGQEDRLIGRDATSTYPPEAEELPNIGYMRALSPEGVLSTAPDLILADEGAGPPETIDVLKGADVPIVFLPDVPTVEGIIDKIRGVGDALGVKIEADALAAQISKDFAVAANRMDSITLSERKRVLFILSTQGGRIMSSGSGTAAAAMIGLAGGVNAIDGFEGYKPLTDEAIAAAAPDVILMMDRGRERADVIQELAALPGIAATAAARNQAIVTMDGLYLLGFGPRTADAVMELNRALYGR